MKNLITVDPRRDDLWNQLVTKQQSMVFHSPAWLRAVSKTYDWKAQAYILVDESGQPVAGLPFCVIDDVRGRRAVCFPFSDACDPLVTCEEDWKQLLEAVLSPGISVSVRSLHNDIPLAATSGDFKQAAWHGVDLDRSIEDIWDGLHGAARRAIRKAEKSGITITVDNSPEALRTFFEMHLQIRKYRYQLLAQPFALFENIFSELIEQGQGFLLFAKLGDQPVAANLYLEWQNTLIYKFSASFYEYMQHRPTDALIWHAINYAKSKKLTYFDFGLSDLDQEGLLRFKRKYATEEKRINFLYFEGDPTCLESVQRQAGALFPALTALFSRTDVPDNISEQAGNVLYRYFG